MMYYYSNLTGEVAENEKELDLMIQEHMEIFEDECDEYDILENIVVCENGVHTNITVFNLMFD